MKKADYDAVCALNGSIQKLFANMAIMQKEQLPFASIEITPAEKNALESATYAINCISSKAMACISDNQTNESGEN